MTVRGMRSLSLQALHMPDTTWLSSHATLLLFFKELILSCFIQLQFRGFGFGFVFSSPSIAQSQSLPMAQANTTLYYQFTMPRKIKSNEILRPYSLSLWMTIEWQYSICKLQYKTQLPKGWALILHHQVLHPQHPFSSSMCQNPRPRTPTRNLGLYCCGFIDTLSQSWHKDKSLPGIPGHELELHGKAERKKAFFSRFWWILSLKGSVGVILTTGSK